MGGFKTQGRDEDTWKAHEEDARAVADAGAFALVLEDMLGLNEWTPKFVKVYGQLGPQIEKAVSEYADEVKSRTFPTEDQVYR